MAVIKIGGFFALIEPSFLFFSKQDQSRVMIIFETPQSSRATIKVTLERNQNGLSDMELDEQKLLNPYCLLVTIPSKLLKIAAKLSL